MGLSQQNIGLYFGSFNPVHIGHLAIANFMVEFTDIKELWFIISPHNPLKKKSTLLNDRIRYDLVYEAVKDDTRFRVSDIEFQLPQPSYTIDTLTYLQEKYPEKQFSIIMGSDGLRTFHKWKNASELVKKYTRYIYPRHGEEKDYILTHENVKIVDAPRFEISSSFIRQAITEQRDVRHFLPKAVFDAIDKGGYYR